MADVNILGPARSLLRVRQQPAIAKRVEAVTVDAEVVRVVFELVETGRKLAITLDQAAWEEMRRRIDRAFIPMDLPGQLRLC